MEVKKEPPPSLAQQPMPEQLQHLTHVAIDHEVQRQFGMTPAAIKEVHREAGIINVIALLLTGACINRLVDAITWEHIVCLVKGCRDGAVHVWDGLVHLVESNQLVIQAH